MYLDGWMEKYSIVQLFLSTRANDSQLDSSSLPPVKVTHHTRLNEHKSTGEADMK